MADEQVMLCRLDDIAEGGAKALEVVIKGKQQPLVAVRRGGQAWLYRNCCPHFSVPLDYNPGDFCTYQSQLIMCAHHSAMFRFEDGLCVDGPCAGAHLESVPCRVEGGALILVEGNAVIVTVG
ncbi:MULTISPECIES: Rieske (2Fe-2S) protein [Pseudomonas]|jgi:nitrite reductase/ring-hydroxylating ferredoxin subunit|uniref:Rieske (2Fe-2S) protein n=1 Tax=Pseudomonas TaxID=286 RepID=UPI00278B1E0C|nr:Rieske 2Fe-2S domain-containing protein [Pseudomonas fluorescens]MDP9780693.1 nitrite reductase/ring-hydroxylating ferredoxin subunit [Pseudomonas fluorescens]